MEIWDKMFPPLQELIHREDEFFPEGVMATQSRLILIYGTQRSGRTTVAHKIVELAVEKYGLHNVNAVWLKYDVVRLLTYGLANKSVNILLCDDLTLQTFKKETMAIFFNIGTRLHELYGRNRGLVLVIATIHRLFSIPIECRSDVDFYVFRTLPSNWRDEAEATRILGREGVKKLREWENLRVTDPTYKSYSYYSYRMSDRGELNLPLPKTYYATKLNIRPKEERRREPFALGILDSIIEKGLKVIMFMTFGALIFPVIFFLFIIVVLIIGYFYYY